MEHMRNEIETYPYLLHRFNQQLLPLFNPFFTTILSQYAVIIHIHLSHP